jgi:hypothetical protein
MIIRRELFDPGYYLWLLFVGACVGMGLGTVLRV